MRTALLGGAALGAALLVASAVAKPHVDGCAPDYQCIFRWIDDMRTTEYSWDFRPLCNPSGYFFRDAAGQNYTFNICGNVSTPCNHKGASQYTIASHGMMTQTWGSGPFVNPSCDPTVCGFGNPLCCEDVEYPGFYSCCTAQCEVLAHTRPEFDLIDPTNPATGGVLLKHDGMQAVQGDPAACQPDPVTNYPAQRQVTIRLLCDPTMTRDSLRAVGLTEAPQCKYTLDVFTGAACGIKGDPFDLVTPAGTNDGANFGFVVLGAALTIFLQVGYEQANKRGWLDSVKARINGYAPGAGGGSGVSVGGSSRVSSPMGTPKAGGGGYNAGASSLDAAPATPFSAGGYGSL